MRAGAPWAFSNEIVMSGGPKSFTPGTVVELLGDDGAALGMGYFNPKSLIAVRLLGPPGADIGVPFFVEKFARAKALRERFYDTPFYRLVHAEADGLPGLVIDRFGDTCVVQVTTAGMERLTLDMLEALDTVIAPTNVIMRNDTASRSLEGLDAYVRAAKGAAPPRLKIEENGVRYFADPSGGQKSGWYYDQRDNRAFMARLAKDARVLDAYCYSGGFGVLAAANGATEIVGIDSSESALALATAAAAENKVAERCTFMKSDVFETLEKFANQKRHFDVVICDPPPFAPSRKDVEAGARAYRKLARMASAIVAPGGFLMLASCSYNVSRERFAVECAAGIARNARGAALIRDAGAGADHPVHPQLPETAYLKALAYRLD